MSTWREQLRPASFRGVRFHVESDSVPVGRVVQLHEYPKRDEPSTEDMGRVSRVHKFPAFVIGEDCLAQRDKLLDALEKGGPGELVHPWLGRMQAKAGACEMQHSQAEGGMVRFDLVFYPDKGAPRPTATPSTAHKVAASNVTAWDMAVGRYRQVMGGVDLAALSVRGLRNNLGGVHALLGRHLGPFAQLFGDVGGLADGLRTSPGGLADALMASLSSVASTFSRAGQSEPSAADAVRAGGFRDYPSTLAVTADLATVAGEVNRTPQAGGAANATAGQALADLVQAALLYQAGRGLAAMPVPIARAQPDQVPALDVQVLGAIEDDPVPVADDVLAVRDQVQASLWLVAEKSSPEQFQAVVDLRQAIGRHLSSVAAQGSRVVTVTPPETVPALVLAYRLYGDARRAQEIATRNAQAHPGFLPAAPLKVLKV